MSLDDAARRAVESAAGRWLLSVAVGAGKWLLSIAVTIILGLSGWTLHTVFELSNSQSSTAADMRNLTAAVQLHNTEVDRQVGDIINTEQQLGQEQAALRQALEDQRRSKD